MEKEDKLSLLREILHNRYTENNVDIIKNTTEGYTLTIYYPEITIYKDTDSNTPIYKRKNIYAVIHISDLYLSTSVKFTSSSYTEAELHYKFVLPHVSTGLSLLENGKYVLSNPCLGRTTYFRAYTLTSELDILNFLEDLEKFMSTESPSGVPFRYCNHVATFNPKASNNTTTLIGNNTIYVYNTVTITFNEKVVSVLLDFIDKKLEDILEIFKFSYMYGELITTNIYKYAIYKLSKTFEDYLMSLDVNKRELKQFLISEKFLLKSVEVDDNICLYTGYTNEINYEAKQREFAERYVCIFKGKKIYPTLILNKEEDEIKETIIVNPHILIILLNKIRSKGLILQNKENESNNNRKITD